MHLIMVKTFARIGAGLLVICLLLIVSFLVQNKTGKAFSVEPDSEDEKEIQDVIILLPLMMVHERNDSCENK